MPSRAAGHNISISSTFVGVCAAYVLTVILSISFSTPVSALQTVPGSPCADICSADDLNFVNDTRCQDVDYETGKGQQFRDCTSCLLNSTAVDTNANISDVYWGLFGLRYSLAECMFAYPAEIVSTSSPCQVTCTPLGNATKYGIGHDLLTATDDTVPNLDFCSHGFGMDNVINNCSFCYTMVPQQRFTSNFLQALHIACRQPPALGQTFYPDGRAIFNETPIAGPAPPSTNTGKSGGIVGWKLGLVIALPIVGGALLFGVGCFCCFKFTKKRRLRMAETGRMSTYHERHPESSFVTPVSGRTPPSKYEWPSPIVRTEPPREMERISVVHTPKSATSHPSPGLAQGRWSRQRRDDEDDDLPLSAIPRDDVGPGEGQAKDPYLHEQYFGVASSGLPDESEPGPSSFIHPDQRRSWGR